MKYSSKHSSGSHPFQWSFQTDSIQSSFFRGNSWINALLRFEQNTIFFLNPCVRHKSREIWVWDRRGGPSLFIRSIRRQIFIGCVRNRVEEKDIGLYVQVSLTVRLVFFLILRFRVLDRVLKELCEFSGLNLSHLKIDLL